MCVCLSSESRVSGQHHLDERVRNFLTLSSLHSEELQEQQLKKYEKEEVALEISCTRLTLYFYLFFMFWSCIKHFMLKQSQPQRIVSYLLCYEVSLKCIWTSFKKLCLICYKFFSCLFWRACLDFLETKGQIIEKLFWRCTTKQFTRKNMLATCHFPIQNFTKKTD